MKGTFFTIEVKDREGTLLKRIKRKSRSLVQQWNELLCVQMGQKTAQSITDTSGENRAIESIGSSFKCEASAADGTYGNVVGRGATAVAIDDYALATLCAEGVGANQLNYYACTISVPTVSAPDCSFTVTRSAINNSGSTITVAEIGIYIGAHDGVQERYLLGIRDVLPSTIDVPDGGAITVTYTIKVTV